MADCSKTEAFLSEARRMCQNTRCKDCQLDEICDDIIQFSRKGFDIVQKWSDEHPAPKPKTYADVFFEAFPNAPKEYDTEYPMVCRSQIFGDGFCPEMFVGADPCSQCWNEPYPKQEN